MKKVETIEDLHAILLQMLVEVDRICKKHNIRYFIAFGTELGAIRSNSFIPWDDDVDIKVLREDYEKFKQVMRQELKEPYFFNEPKDLSPYFFDFVPGIVNRDYALNSEDEWQGYFKGINNNPSVDVFIIDHIPANIFKQKKWFFDLKVLHVLSISKRPIATYEKYTLAQKVILMILRGFGKLYSIDSLIDKYDKTSRRYENEKTAFRATSNFIFGILALYDWDIYESEKKVLLDGVEFSCPERYDEELRLVYGDDYMTPKKMGITHYNKEK